MCVCDDDICATIRRLGWSDDGATIFFLARQGWAKSVTSVFQWQMGDPRPRELLATEDVLVGCELHGSDLICARERSEEHTSELQSLMRISYAVFCLKKKKT